MKIPKEIKSPRSGGGSILVIYTGGTLGMQQLPDEKGLAAVPFEDFLRHVPEVVRLDFGISIVSTKILNDSSNMQPQNWVEIASVIDDNYDQFTGFVVLHGTDTMAYTASALSFMLKNLNKPVVMTGAQLPIGEIRNDARENFLTSCQIAADKKEGESVVKEVCVYFNHHLYRGNRVQKIESDQFDAFASYNYACLAEIGVFIDYKESMLFKPKNEGFECMKSMDTRVGLLKLFPGISEAYVASVLNNDILNGVVLESFGAGNVPDLDWLHNLLSRFIQHGGVVLNVSQCNGGHLYPGYYNSSQRMKELGVISGRDITSEAALPKLMYVLGTFDEKEVPFVLQTSLSGEISNENV